MLVYRIANKKYIKDLSGLGAKQYGGRWNEIGISVLYTASNVSLASLEVLANIQFVSVALDFHLVVLDIPNNLKIEVLAQKLPSDWTKKLTLTQNIGYNWIDEGENLLFEVPSAIVPFDKNILINPLHYDFNKIKIIDNFPFNFDNRLLK